MAVAPEGPQAALLRAAFQAPRHAAELLRVLLPDELLGLVSLRSLELHSGADSNTDDGTAHGADDQKAGQRELLFRADMAGDRGFLGFIFEPHGHLALRVLGCQHRIWQRFWRGRPGEPLPPILLVALSDDLDDSSAPRDLEDLLSPAVREQPALRALMPRFRCIVRHSSQLSGHDLALGALSAFPSLVLWALRDARTPGQILLTLDQWADALTNVASMEGGQDALEQLFLYILNVAEERAFDPLTARVCRLAPAAKPALVTVAERLKAEGTRQGTEHGLAQGRRQALEMLMTLKFGPLSDAIPAWIRAADVELLDRWLARILTASSPSAVVEL
jgi:putative YhgA-like transposase